MTVLRCGLPDASRPIFSLVSFPFASNLTPYKAVPCLSLISFSSVHSAYSIASRVFLNIPHGLGSPDMEGLLVLGQCVLRAVLSLKLWPHQLCLSLFPLHLRSGCSVAGRESAAALALCSNPGKLWTQANSPPAAAPALGGLRLSHSSAVEVSAGWAL